MILATSVTGSLTGGASAVQGKSAVAGPRGAGAAAGPSDFANVMAQLGEQAAANVKNGEAAAILGATGQLSTQQVVQAVVAAEQTLQAAISVRDKFVAAYQEISRMTI